MLRPGAPASLSREEAIRLITEVADLHVALGVVIAAVAIASHRARQRRDGQALPAWMTWWAIAGLLSVFPVAATGSVDALIATNLVRLSWILAVSIVLLRRSTSRSLSVP